MARSPRTEGVMPLSPDVKLWEPQPGEPAIWYTRFVEYLKLGPTRTMQRVRNDLCQRTGKQAYKCGGHWSTAACKWRWQERARAWDIEQCQLDAADQRAVAMAARAARVAVMQEIRDYIREVLRNANLEDVSEAEARKMFPQMARLLVLLLRAERQEFEVSYEDPSAMPERITADDLRAAQRKLDRMLAAEQAQSDW